MSERGAIQVRDAYDDIREERAKQDQKWGGASHDDRHGVVDWVSYITHHAVSALADANLFTFRRQMVRVAALAVAAIESADRADERSRR